LLGLVASDAMWGDLFLYEERHKEYGHSVCQVASGRECIR